MVIIWTRLFCILYSTTKQVVVIHSFSDKGRLHPRNLIAPLLSHKKSPLPQGGFFCIPADFLLLNFLFYIKKDCITYAMQSPILSYKIQTKKEFPKIHPFPSGSIPQRACHHSSGTATSSYPYSSPEYLPVHAVHP